jgi:NTP pyrophosphatase (non-canonical NTP hydrolase)
MKISEFQKKIEEIYFQRDKSRGLAGTYLWFMEEVGELTRALNRPEDARHGLEDEFADVLAWLNTLASIKGIDMEKAAQKYAHGCPCCHNAPCTCSKK